jgi:hypothetical protein
MAFIIITLLFFFFMITHIDNESAQITDGIITSILNKMFLKEKNIQVETSTLPIKESNIKCEISLSDCSLALLLGLYISIKKLRLFGVM